MVTPRPCKDIFSLFNLSKKYRLGMQVFEATECRIQKRRNEMNGQEKKNTYQQKTFNHILQLNLLNNGSLFSYQKLISNRKKSDKINQLENYVFYE